MPHTDLFILIAVFLGGLFFYRYRERILEPLRRFDARNRARRMEEIQSRRDPYAHYRQTLALAEEQIEEVAKIREKDVQTGETVERYLFLGEVYVTLKEAEDARFAAVVEKAREFYKDLDRIYLGRQPRREAMGDRPSTEEVRRPPP